MSLYLGRHRTTAGWETVTVTAHDIGDGIACVDMSLQEFKERLRGLRAPRRPPHRRDQEREQERKRGRPPSETFAAYMAANKQRLMSEKLEQPPSADYPLVPGGLGHELVRHAGRLVPIPATFHLNAPAGHGHYEYPRRRFDPDDVVGVNRQILERAHEHTAEPDGDSGIRMLIFNAGDAFHHLSVEPFDLMCARGGHGTWSMVNFPYRVLEDCEGTIRWPFETLATVVHLSAQINSGAWDTTEVQLASHDKAGRAASYERTKDTVSNFVALGRETHMKALSRKLWDDRSGPKYLENKYRGTPATRHSAVMGDRFGEHLAAGGKPPTGVEQSRAALAVQGSLRQGVFSTPVSKVIENQGLPGRIFPSVSTTGKFALAWNFIGDPLTVGVAGQKYSGQVTCDGLLLPRSNNALASLAAGSVKGLVRSMQAKGDRVNKLITPALGVLSVPLATILQVVRGAHYIVRRTGKALTDDRTGVLEEKKEYLRTHKAAVALDVGEFIYDTVAPAIRFLDPTPVSKVGKVASDVGKFADDRAVKALKHRRNPVREVAKEYLETQKALDDMISSRVKKWRGTTGLSTLAPLRRWETFGDLTLAPRKAGPQEESESSSDATQIAPTESAVDASSPSETTEPANPIRRSDFQTLPDYEPVAGSSSDVEVRPLTGKPYWSYLTHDAPTVQPSEAGPLREALRQSQQSLSEASANPEVTGFSH
ncbi:hypothetical protein [Streptomyces sp. NPDC023327]|uniref:hypothetical protein n=1 Tax=Streptomyces sp. NPDC023327 TaxID=3157088 RepID=UPI0034096CA3